EAVHEKRALRVFTRRPVGNHGDPAGHWWPHYAEDQGQAHGRESGENRDKALSSEEAEVLRQPQLVVAVVEYGRDGAHHDAAKDTGIEVFEPQDWLNQAWVDSQRLNAPFC